MKVYLMVSTVTVWQEPVEKSTARCRVGWILKLSPACLIKLLAIVVV